MIWFYYETLDHKLCQTAHSTEAYSTHLTIQVQNLIKPKSSNFSQTVCKQTRLGVSNNFTTVPYLRSLKKSVITCRNRIYFSLLFLYQAYNKRIIYKLSFVTSNYCCTFSKPRAQASIVFSGDRIDGSMAALSSIRWMTEMLSLFLVYFVFVIFCVSFSLCLLR